MNTIAPMGQPVTVGGANEQGQADVGRSISQEQQRILHDAVVGARKSSEVTDSTAQNGRKNDLTRDDLQKMADELKKSLGKGTNLDFRIEQELQKLVVSVVEQGSGDVIRQIPSDEMLALSRHLRHVQGTIFDTEA
jgi:flagellar protein FlaG